VIQKNRIQRRKGIHMIEDSIQIFEGLDSPELDWSAGHPYTYEYQACQSDPGVPGGGLKPAAFACSKVIGNTVTLT
jgi:nitrate reductase beta subunit